MSAIGEVDEANSAVGAAIAALPAAHPLAGSLRRVQNELFDLGADIATPNSVDGALRILPGQVERLEREIDRLNEGLDPLTSFILPGGSLAVALLHLSRAVTRRAERAAAALASQEAVGPCVLPYLNRLSDLLFVAGRSLAAEDAGDVLWEPGATRN
jgi:cob(I)alamin adenosyltransferase